MNHHQPKLQWIALAALAAALLASCASPDLRNPENPYEIADYDEKKWVKSEEVAVDWVSRKAKKPLASQTPQSMIMSAEKVFFSPGEAEIDSLAARELKRLAKEWGQDPATRIKIEGHADAAGEKDGNQELALRRAREVRDFLVRNGLKRRQISISAAGEKEPVAPNEDARGRAENRRVEIIQESMLGG